MSKVEYKPLTTGTVYFTYAVPEIGFSLDLEKATQAQLKALYDAGYHALVEKISKVKNEPNDDNS